MKNPKDMSISELFYARKDLREVIKVQEDSLPSMFCPKLGQYWDELAAVLQEIRRRQASPVVCTECGHKLLT